MVALGVAVGAVLAAALPAAAHDELLETSPAAGSTLAAPPVDLTLMFSEDVLDISTQVIVRDASGAAVIDTAGTTQGAQVTAQFPTALAAGAYTVAWRVVSGDGHPIQGAFEFSVAASSPAAPSPSAASPPGAEPLATATPPSVTSPSAGADAEPSIASRLAWAGVGGVALLAGIVAVLRRAGKPPAP